jgi:3-oxoacyl-(acyl-carrier-protein) synthase/NAD(P)-dependent dehydrogenase (short-subunit alcohol dehydrogenase family)/uncharacterized ubiquitin-like protein YukD
LFAAVRTNYGIPRREDLRLSDYTTLKKVIGFVMDAGGASSEVTRTVEVKAVTAPAPTAPKTEVMDGGLGPSPRAEIRDGRLPLTGSVVISGAGLGLPGRNGRVFSEDNIDRILSGELLIEPLSEETRQAMLEKRVTRLIKSDAGAEMQLIDQLEQTIKLGGQRGAFDLAEEFGVPADRVTATDISTQLAIAAGIDALRDAGIPLVMNYKQTSKGTYLPDRWRLPEALADETGVIFGSAFPGLDQMAAEAESYYEYTALVKQANELRGFLALIPDGQVDLRRALEARIEEINAKAEKLNYHFDRRFVFRILSMGHSQFAEHIGARGPNTHVNAACATTTHAVALAEDWIRAGRARRVVVVAGDDITSGHLVNWVGTGLMASGAATIEGNPRLAILPFDRRRNGMIMGMGGAALVIEAEDAVRERGMSGIAEILATNIANSAYHGTRLDVSHVSDVMERLVRTAELRFGIQRAEIAAKTVFVSHETYTPARGGSAAAEIRALRSIFGHQANQVVIANTKGFTGHTMGVGIEDVVAVKALETGKVPPIANIHENFEPDPDLGDLNLSHGGQYNPEYSLRLGAGFGSQIAMSLLRKIPTVAGRVAQGTYSRWLAEVAGYDHADLEVVQHTLRIRHMGVPRRAPRKSTWEYGQGPIMWASQNGLADLKIPETSPAPVVRIATPQNDPAPLASVAIVHAQGGADQEAIKSFVIGLVSEKTGYPAEMLDLDLDLEADLGIDTVKQAELFAAVRTQYGIPRRENLRLSDYNTLTKVIGFVTDALQEMKTAVEPVKESGVEAKTDAGSAENGGLIAYPRRVPVPVLRPRLDLCLPTQISLDENSRVIVIGGRGKTGEALVKRLKNRKVQTLLVPAFSEELEKKVGAFAAEGAVQGVYFLPALDVEGGMMDLSAAAFQQELDTRTMAFYTVLKEVAGHPFVVSATRLGGLHGYGPEGSDAPLGGAVSGLTKALGLERSDCYVKVVDFEREAPDGDIAAALIAETLSDPAVVEVGRHGGLRYTIRLADETVGTDNFELAESSVFLVSGGSGGIIGPIVTDLARATHGTFYLLSRTILPDRSDADLARLGNDRSGLKVDLGRRLAESGVKATPAVIDQQIARLERAAQTLESIAAVERAGGQVIYLPCDITDEQSCQAVMERIAADGNKVDVLIHAAGVERSRKLETKSADEFRQTLAVKVTGLHHLLVTAKARGLTPRALVLFSSVAGRFGNTGQTDYAAANDALCKMAKSLPRQIPEMKTLVLDWGAWAEVGMASRGFIPELMRRSGIEMMQPASAAILVRREIVRAASGAEVLLAGELGALLDRDDSNGGLDLEKANAALSERKALHTMLTQVTGLSLDHGTVLEAELDPAQEPFLRDHALNGIPLLPGVMGIEGLSSAALYVTSILASEKQQYQATRIEDVHFYAAFKFYRGENRKLTWKANVMRWKGELVARVELESTVKRFGRDPETIVHFGGKVYLQPVDSPVESKKDTPPHWNGARTLDPDTIYKLYFHGPAFQVLDGVQQTGEQVMGKLRGNLPAITAQEHGLATAPLMVELCLQTAGIWEIGKTGALALPSRIGSLRLYPIPEPTGVVFAEVKPRKNDDGVTLYDARVLDAEGRVYLELENYSTEPLPYTLEETLLAPVKEWLDGRG